MKPLYLTLKEKNYFFCHKALILLLFTLATNPLIADIITAQDFEGSFQNISKNPSPELFHQQIKYLDTLDHESHEQLLCSYTLIKQWVHRRSIDSSIIETLTYLILSKDNLLQFIPDAMNLAMAHDAYSCFINLYSKYIQHTEPPRQQAIYKNYATFIQQIGVDTFNHENAQCNIQIRNLNAYEALMARIFVDEAYLQKYNLTHKQYFDRIALTLQELLMDDNFHEVAHLIAIHNLWDPYSTVIGTTKSFEINDLFKTTSTLGQYESLKHQVHMFVNAYAYNAFKEVLAHEWTHQLMQILFINNFNPYKNNDQSSKDQFESIVQNLKTKMNELASTSTNPLLNCVINKFRLKEKGYNDDETHREFIARYMECLTNKYYQNDPEVLEFLQPIKIYWDKHISPKIKTRLQDISPSRSIEGTYTSPKELFDSLELDLRNAQIQNEYQQFLDDNWHLILFNKTMRSITLLPSQLFNLLTQPTPTSS